MSEFDDRELGDALRRRAGAVTDGLGVEAARAAVVARANRVHRRRAAVAGGAAMAGLVAAAVFLVGPGTDSVVTSPVDQTDASRPDPVSSVDTTESATTDPDPTGPAQDVIDTAPPADTAPNPVTTVPTVNPPTATSTTAPPAPGTTVVTPPTTPAPTPPTTPTTSVPGTPPGTQTHSSAGGSITVQWDGVALDLQTTTPAAGFEAEVEDDRPDRIRVRFRGVGGDVRIELRVEDGHVVRVE